MTRPPSRKTLVTAVALELLTGLALIVAPGIVIELLLGGAGPGLGPAIGRLLGIALLTLGMACWPIQDAGRSSPAFRAMLTYNVLIAGNLALLGAVEHFSGYLLWPAVVVHAVLAVLLVWPIRL